MSIYVDLSHDQNSLAGAFSNCGLSSVSSLIPELYRSDHSFPHSQDSQGYEVVTASLDTIQYSDLTGYVATMVVKLCEERQRSLLVDCRLFKGVRRAKKGVSVHGAVRSTSPSVDDNFCSCYYMYSWPQMCLQTGFGTSLFPRLPILSLPNQLPNVALPHQNITHHLLFPFPSLQNLLFT
jgi:hypothetical protein